jgi:WD40 repeat protein
VASRSEAGFEVRDLASGDVHIKAPYLVTEIAFSPDGTAVFVASENAVLMWSLETLNDEPVRVFEGHADELVVIAVSPNSRYLLTVEVDYASEDSEIRIWDIQTGEIKRLFSIEKLIVDAVFSPNGRFVLSNAALFQGISLVDTDLGTFVQKLCAYPFRDFTSQERVLYNIQDGLPACLPMPEVFMGTGAE